MKSGTTNFLLVQWPQTVIGSRLIWQGRFSNWQLFKWGSYLGLWALLWQLCFHPVIHRIFLIWIPMCLCSAVLHNKGGPSMPVMHPKRSPTSTGDRELREGRMPPRKASCSVMGSRSLPPSSPMVSSANNPNKSEIPDRRKDMTATTVSDTFTLQEAESWASNQEHRFYCKNRKVGLHYSASIVLLLLALT